MISPVRKIREALLLTQDELATQLGVSRQMVCYYEGGKMNPGFGVIRKLLIIAKQHRIDIDAADFFVEH